MKGFLLLLPLVVASQTTSSCPVLTNFEAQIINTGTLSSLNGMNYMISFNPNSPIVPNWVDCHVTTVSGTQYNKRMTTSAAGSFQANDIILKNSDTISIFFTYSINSGSNTLQCSTTPSFQSPPISSQLIRAQQTQNLGGYQISQNVGLGGSSNQQSQQSQQLTQPQLTQQQQQQLTQQQQNLLSMLSIGGRQFAQGLSALTAPFLPQGFGSLNNNYFNQPNNFLNQQPTYLNQLSPYGAFNSPQSSTNWFSSLLNRAAPNVKASATLNGNKGVSGVIYFDQLSGSDSVTITGTITGLAPGLHGFHVHEFGATDCDATGEHYNPFNQPHGAPTDTQRHVGDLGNVNADSTGTAIVDKVDDVISLVGSNNILGRTVVVHKLPDDLGRGGYPDSLTSGHSGERLACGIIGVYNL